MLTQICFQARMHSLFGVYSKLQKTWPESPEHHHSAAPKLPLQLFKNYSETLFGVVLQIFVDITVCHEMGHLWLSPVLVNEIITVSSQ